jgi:tetratricopeptide (TPR) repeat protein
MIQIGTSLLLVLFNIQFGFLGTGLYDMPQGDWAKHRIVPVKQFGPGPGGEFGIGFGRELNFQLIGKYLRLKTSSWDRYAQDSLGIELESNARLWAFLGRLEVNFSTSNITPLCQLGLGYFAPSGGEQYYRPEYGETLSYPYTFLKKSLGLSLGAGLAWSPIGPLRLIPKVQYTTFAGIGYPEGSPYSLAHLLEAGLSVEVIIREAGEAERLAQELALKLKEKEEKTSQSYVDQGITFFNLERYPEAINAFDHALLWDPNNIKADEWLKRGQRTQEESELDNLLKKAEEALNSGDWLEAIAQCDSALKIDPEHLEAQRLKAQATQAQEEARSHSIALEVHFTQGTDFYLAGDYAQAIAEWEAMLEIDPDNPDAAQHLSRTQAKLKEVITERLIKAERYMKEEKWSSALRECELILAQDPQNLEAQETRRMAARWLEEEREDLLKRGIKLYEMGNYLDAEATFSSLLRLDPKKTQVQLWLERTRAQKAKLGKEMAHDLYLKGVEAYTQEDFSTAIFYWTKVLEVVPDHENARRNIHRAEQKLEALKRYEAGQG